VDAVYRWEVTYLTLRSRLHHESRNHSLRSPHGAREARYWLARSRY